MRWVAAGATCCALAVAAGAFGAHGLEGSLSPDDLRLWETAARYLMYGGLALTALGLFSGASGREVGLAAGSLLAGTVVFASTVFALATGAPGWLGAITPIGGVLMIAGLAVFAVKAWRSPGRSGHRKLGDGNVD